MILDTLRVLGSNLAVNLSSFLVLALAGRVMPVDQFAQLSLIVAASQLASSALDLGTNVGTVKKYSETKQARFLATLIWLKVAVACCCLALLAVGYGQGVPPAWLIVLACAASIDLWSGARALDQARMDFAGLAQANIAFAALRTVLGIAGLATGNAFIVAMAFFIGPLLAVAAYKWRATAGLAERFDAGTAREVLRYAWPVYVSAILFTIAMYYPQFVIARRLDAAAVSTFGLLLIFLGPLGLINVSLRVYLLPRVAGKELSRADVLGNPRAMALIGATLVLGLVGVAFGAVVVDYVYGIKYPGIGLPFWIFISLWLVTLYIGIFNLDVHRLGRVDVEAWVNAARLAALVVALALFGHDLLSIVIASGFVMLAGECILFAVIADLAGRESVPENSSKNGHPQLSPASVVNERLRDLTASVAFSQREPATAMRFAVVCKDLDWQSWQWQAVEALGRKKCGRLMGVVRLADTSNEAAASFGDDAPPQVIDCRGVDDGHGAWRLDEAGVAAVVALDLDFLLVFGVERLQGDVLAAARHGAWCFPGFGARADEQAGLVCRPVLDDDVLTEVALVRLGPSIGRDVVLKRAFLRTQNTPRDNFGMVTRTCAEWPSTLASMLAAGSPLAHETFTETAWHDAVKPPPVSKSWQAAARPITQLASKVASFAFSYDVWHVGMARTDLKGLIANGVPANVTWAPSPGFGRFYADPMGVETASGTKVFCEDYSYWSGRASLSVLDFSATSGFSPHVESLLSEPFHLSYPAILERGGRKFCVPECCEAGVVYAYPLDANGRIAGERQVFLPFEVADPTFVQHEGRWYLFGSTAAEAQYTLRIWFAKSLDGPWTEHPANPVKCDIHSARCAGPFASVGGRLYRPAQNSGQSYGAAANLMEVVELSPTAFREVTARKIEPNAAWPYPHGIHTLTVTRDGVLVDAKVVRRSPFALLLRGINFVQARRRRRRQGSARGATALVVAIPEMTAGRGGIARQP